MDLTLAFTCPDEYFNVRDTLECGQIFRYKRNADGSYGVFSQDKYALAVQSGGQVSVYALPQDRDYFVRFFDLDTDYSAKVNRISALSPVMNEAAQYGKGIRILNQDLTETIFGFIISANNNIKRIQLIIERLCAALGKRNQFGYAFPTVETMARQTVDFYTQLGAGYRDRYLLQTAQTLLNYDVDALRRSDSAQARKQLLTFAGVGPKVADCILLFGLKRGDVFPVDTWLKKVYHQYFEQGHKDAEISSFFCNLFGADAGLCQQYLFYFERNHRQNDINTVQ